MNLSDYGALQYTQMLVGLASPPASMYIALCLSEPTPSGAGTDLVEPTDATGYVRKVINTSDWALVASDVPTVVNTPAFTWTPAVDWATVSYVALCTSVGTNKVWCWTEISPVAPLTGRAFVLPASSLVLSVAGPSELVML